MKKIVMLLSFSSLFLVLAACGGKQQNDEPRWSKPQRVLEGCDGTRSNSQQCQKDPNSQQLMIQIDRN